jgi:hypothetical protein
MLKKMLQMSVLASVLAMGMALPASAAVYSEEDAAAPAGSFTSEMAAPMSPRFEAFLARHPEFARHMHERMMRRAEMEQNRDAR